MWHATAAFALGVVLLVADFPLVSEWSVLPAQAWARLGVLAGMGALQLARERAPLAAFLAGLPLLGLDLAMGLTLPVLVIAADQLCSTVIHGPHRAVRIIKALLVLYVAGVVVVAVLTMPTLRGALLLVMATAPLPALPVWWGLNVRAQRERAEAERARADYVAALAILASGAGWQPPVLSCSSATGQGFPEVWQAILRHRDAMGPEGLAHKRSAQARRWMWREVEDGLLAALKADPEVAA